MEKRGFIGLSGRYLLIKNILNLKLGLQHSVYKEYWAWFQMSDHAMFYLHMNFLRSTKLLFDTIQHPTIIILCLMLAGWVHKCTLQFEIRILNLSSFIMENSLLSYFVKCYEFESPPEGLVPLIPLDVLCSEMASILLKNHSEIIVLHLHVSTPHVIAC